jgi:hypothetical protein
MNGKTIVSALCRSPATALLLSPPNRTREHEITARRK